MKTQNLFFMLILISMAFSFISCTDEDDKVEIPQFRKIFHKDKNFGVFLSGSRKNP